MYVVFESDRGMGTMIIGIYHSEEKAKAAAEVSHCLYREATVED